VPNAENPIIERRQQELIRQARNAAPTMTIANVQVGPASTHNAAPAHTAGVRFGNRVRPVERVRGLREENRLFAVATAERSTGINPRRRNPIDPDSPNLPPP
jgi:hypothetical protein